MPKFGVRKIGHDAHYSYDQCTLLRNKYGIYRLLGRNVNLDGVSDSGLVRIPHRIRNVTATQDRTHILYRFFSKTFSPSIPTTWKDGWPQGLL